MYLRNRTYLTSSLKVSMCHVTGNLLICLGCFQGLMLIEGSVNIYILYTIQYAPVCSWIVPGLFRALASDIKEGNDINMYTMSILWKRACPELGEKVRGLERPLKIWGCALSSVAAVTWPMFLKIDRCSIDRDVRIQGIFMEIAFQHAFLGKKKNFYILSGIGWERCELLCLTGVKKPVIVVAAKHSNSHRSQPIPDEI